MFDYAERGGEGLWAGSSLGIATGFQTRDNARITWVGGIDLFSDDYANKPLPSCVLSVPPFPLNLMTCLQRRQVRKRAVRA